MQPVCNNPSVTFINYETAEERFREIEKVIDDKVQDLIGIMGMSPQIDHITQEGIIHISHGKGSREKVIAFMHEHGLLSQNSSNQYCYKDVPIEFEASGPAYAC